MISFNSDIFSTFTQCEAILGVKYIGFEREIKRPEGNESTDVSRCGDICGIFNG